MRATDGRPYELKSVPTKTVAIRTTGNCAYLVQKLYPHPAFPLRGRCRRKPTDEVESNPCALRTPYLFTITFSLFTCRRSLPRGRCRRSRRMRCFFNSGFTFYLYFYCVGPTGDSGKTGTAGDRWSPLRIGLSAGRAFAPCLREAAHLRFSPQLRYRATAISVSVGASMRL